LEGNRVVFWVCLIVSVLGVVLASLGVPREVTALSPELVGQDVVLIGTINTIRMHNGNAFLSVNGFRVVIFSKDAHRLGVTSLTTGTRVALLGSVREYHGEIELVVRDLVD